jgi:hypothetical protein
MLPEKIRATEMMSTPMVILYTGQTGIPAESTKLTSNMLARFVTKPWTNDIDLRL